MQEHQKKKNFYWGVAILAVVVATGVAWAQITAAVTQCLSPFK
jgi:hypothetical protein